MRRRMIRKDNVMRIVGKKERKKVHKNVTTSKKMTNK
jgi:hypothetical protein